MSYVLSLYVENGYVVQTAGNATGATGDPFPEVCGDTTRKAVRFLIDRIKGTINFFLF